MHKIAVKRIGDTIKEYDDAFRIEFGSVNKENFDRNYFVNFSNYFPI